MVRDPTVKEMIEQRHYSARSTVLGVDFREKIKKIAATLAELIVEVITLARALLRCK